MSAADDSSRSPAPAPAPALAPARAVIAQPRAAMAVVRAMNREIQRQRAEGAVISADNIDANGVVRIEGRLDVAMLAFVAEIALRHHFPSLGPLVVETKA